MTEYQIAVVDGLYRVYATRNGIDQEFVGPRWRTPTEAARYADTLSVKVTRVSPLRASGEDPAVPPLAGSSPEPLTGLNE